MTTMTEDLRLQLSHMQRDVNDLDVRLSEVELKQQEYKEFVERMIKRLDSRLASIEKLMHNSYAWIKGSIVGALLVAAVTLGSFNIDTILKILAVL